MQPLMDRLLDANRTAHFARNRELAFLANALMAGCSVHARPFTAQEAWQAAFGICNLALEVSPGRWGETSADAASTTDRGTPLPDLFLVDHDLVTVFEAGWRLLHADVSVFVAARLSTALASLRSADPDIQRDLHLLDRALERYRERGEPWRAREALEVIAILDMPTWAALRGLLSECPVLPAAVPAILDGHAGAVSATAFETFATRAQIRQVHDFAERLPELLLR
jgi:hypothetical protein